jgi:non-ribosomal peptide synthetase component F
MSTPFELRAAEPRDVPAIVGLITELAEFENLTHLLKVTPAKLHPQLFGGRPAAEAVVAESAGEVVGFALFFTNFSTFLAQPGLYLEDLYVKPARRGLRVERARLERERDPLLPAHGRDRDDGVANLPRGWRGVAVVRLGRTAMTQDRYAELHREFRWAVPAQFNIAEVCCTRWARDTPEAIAIRCENEDGATAALSYAELQRDANRLSHALRKLGVQRGDRVALVLPQRFETAVAHIAIYQLGAVAMPLSMLFGPEALEYRFNHSEARIALVDEGGIVNVLASRPACPGLKTVIAVGGAAEQGDVDWRAAPTKRPCSSTPAAPPARPRAH